MAEMLTLHRQLSWQIGQDTAVRNQFVKHRLLANTQEKSFRAVNDRW